MSHSGPKRTPATARKSVLVQLEPDVYNAASNAASLLNLSLNQFVVQAIEAASTTPTENWVDAARVSYATSLIAQSAASSPTLYAQSFNALRSANNSVVLDASTRTVNKLSGKEDQ